MQTESRLNACSLNNLRLASAESTADVALSEGNSKEYDADLRRRKGAEADQPHRVSYKKLVRS
jgi:energy-dependent translational throttle protein EttA